jgi:hypothetical protein
MYTEHAVSILVPILVLAVLWVVVRHWIMPFVLGFALAVALGPSARPLLASAWEAVAQVGDTIFGTDRDMGEPGQGDWGGVHQGEVDTRRSDRLLFESR